MRIRDFRADDSPQIELIPLIDVVLCLIVFFVVTTAWCGVRASARSSTRRSRSSPATSAIVRLSDSMSVRSASRSPTK